MKSTEFDIDDLSPITEEYLREYYESHGYKVGKIYIKDRSITVEIFENLPVTVDAILEGEKNDE